MEHQKILNLLYESNKSKFVRREWDIVNDQSNANYDVGNEIIYNTEVLKYNLCDYNEAYILVRGNIAIIGHHVTQVAFKYCAPFTKCITQIDGTTIDDAEDLDLVMPMYNLIEYSSNYSETTGSLWFHSKDEAINFNADIANINNFKSFMYKAKLSETTEADGGNGILKNTTVFAPLKYLSHFWRSRKMPLINYCVLSAAGADNANAKSNNNIFTIKDTKLYVPVVTLSARENQKLSKLPSKEFERSVYWNEYKTKSEKKNTTNEYIYFLKSHFVGVNRLFVLVYTNQDTNAKGFKTRRYDLPKGIIKNFNFIINGKNFFDQAVDLDTKRSEEIRKLTTGQGEHYSTGCLLDYDYIKNH